MTLYWYKLLNISEFEDRGVSAIEVDLALDGIGDRKILVTSGIAFGVTYEGIFLSIGLNDKNPFVFDNTCAYLDANNDIFLGLVRAD